MHTRPFVDLIKSNQELANLECEPQDFICKMLQNLLKVSDEVGCLIDWTNEYDLMTAVRNGGNKDRSQQDADEVFSWLLNYDDSMFSYLLRQVFQFQQTSVIRTCADASSSTTDTAFTIQLSISDCTTLQDCLSKYFQSEPVTDIQCVNCKDNEQSSCHPTKTLSLASFPPVLAIQLKRFEYHRDIGSLKNQGVVDYPSVIMVDGIIDGRPVNQMYQLYALIVHKGTLEEGHYFAFCRSFDRVWLKMDDLNVDLSYMDEALLEMDNVYLLYYEKISSVILEFDAREVNNSVNGENKITPLQLQVIEDSRNLASFMDYLEKDATSEDLMTCEETDEDKDVVEEKSMNLRKRKRQVVKDD